MDRRRLFRGPGAEREWDAADQHLKPHGHEGIDVDCDPFDQHIADRNSECGQDDIGHADDVAFVSAREKPRRADDENPEKTQYQPGFTVHCEPLVKDDPRQHGRQ